MLTVVFWGFSGSFFLTLPCSDLPFPWGSGTLPQIQAAMRGEEAGGGHGVPSSGAN